MNEFNFWRISIYVITMFIKQKPGTWVKQATWKILALVFSSWEKRVRGELIPNTS